MAAATIDHATLVDLARSARLGKARAVARSGGWTVEIRQGDQDRTLMAQRSREARVFRRMETLVAYLGSIGIVRFEVDARAYDPNAVSDNPRPDRAAALRDAHGAAAHDVWFRAQVRQALAEADSVDPGWVDDKTARVLWAEKRNKLQARGQA